jgi:hypothetical protein
MRASVRPDRPFRDECDYEQTDIARTPSEVGWLFPLSFGNILIEVRCQARTAAKLTDAERMTGAVVVHA